MISSQHIAKASIALADKHPHNIEKIADDVMKFVQKYHLETQLPAILHAIEIELTQRAREETLTIHSPYALDHAALAHIRKFIGAGENVKTEVTEDRALIGGFLAYWQDKKIDGSIAHALATLQESLAA